MTNQTKATEKPKSKKQLDPKYRVIPNLSLRGPDLMSRINNRTIAFNHSGQYSLDEKIDATRRMSKADIMRESLSNQEKINKLKADLSKKTTAS